MSSTTRSTVATTPRLAASAPQTPFEAGGLEGEVALPVGHRGVEEGDVRGVGLEQADPPNGVSTWV